MSEPLTREQQQRFDELFKMLDGTESADDCYGILRAAWDAGAQTQRAMIAALQAQRDTAERNEHAAMLKIEELELRLANSEKAAYDVAGTIDSLKQQLAAAQAELALYDTVPHDKDGTPFAAASAWRAACNRLQRQLIEAQAELARRKEA